MSLNAPEIAVIGGGTGSFTILQELKEFTPNITAIVNMSDDGGSTGKLRDEHGVLPPGDVRQCLVALSTLPEVRDMFDFRFGEGANEGQSLGNFILAGLEKLHKGDYKKAIAVASNLLQIVGQVVPVTLTNHHLVMYDGDEVIHGERIIGHRQINNPAARVELEPKSQIDPDAATAIRESDIVVIAPGNLYGSLLPALAVEGMRQAFAESHAKKVLISSLVNKPGQTDGWHIVDYVHKVEEYIGDGQIEHVLYNNEPPAKDLLCKYAHEGEFPPDTSEGRFSEIQARAIGACLISKQIHIPSASDIHAAQLKRSLIRHDALQVGRQLMRLHYS